MNKKDRNWMLSRLDVAVDRASAARQYAAAIHDDLEKFKRFRIAKGEAMNPDEIERYGREMKAYSNDMLRSLGSLQAAVAHCFPKDEEKIDG